MNSPPGVITALERLHRLQAVVRDFAAREEKQERDFRARSEAQRKRFEDLAEKVNARRSEEVTAAETVLHARQQALQARVAGRRARIAAAHDAASRNVMERIEAREGRQKYEIQRKTLEANRTWKDSLANNDATLADFQRRLAEIREAFAVLERAAKIAFRGYRRFGQWLHHPPEPDPPDVSKDEYQLLDALVELHSQTSDGLSRFYRFVLPGLFRYVRAWLLAVLLVLGHVFAIPAVQYFGVIAPYYEAVAISLGTSLALLTAAYFFGRHRAAPLAATIAGALEEARRLDQLCHEKAQARHQQEIKRIEDDYQAAGQMLSQRWEQVVDEAAKMRHDWPSRLEEKTRRVQQKHEERTQVLVQQLERERAATLERIEQAAREELKKLEASRDQGLAKLNAAHEADWKVLETEWRTQLQPLYNAIRDANAAAGEQFPDWSAQDAENWSPPAQFANAVQFGRLDVDVTELCGATPASDRLALPGPSSFRLPLVLTYPQQGSLLFEVNRSGGEELAGALNNIVLRLLAKSPPGRVSFTIIDPVKLGQNFAGVMHLADYAEHLINNRIWTQSSQIEQRLADLNEHMEKVIQMYLRNEYATIAEYNEQAGNIAEKYHFVVIADFPVNFSETAVRRLLNIAASGARCGVFTLVHWDHRQPLPPGVVAEDLRKNSVVVKGAGAELILAGAPGSGIRLVLDPPPDPDFTSKFLHLVGQRNIDSNRVEVPFAQVAPPDAELWSGDATEELRVPIGRTGATKFQHLALGKGTCQHALIAGKTGSGKSTLFHVMITNLAAWFSPEQVEFYLVDFKKGVEFKCYASARLPHARVVAIESDREFGLSVLQRVDAELRRRGDLFRQLGVQDLAGYKRNGGKESVPRTLLLIDEFQEFFTEDDQISQNAAVLLDRIVRQGRAFGIHVLLGSQTLGGAYTLARATLGQMVIRIALQCNEADAYLIMDDSNPAPRLLSRPGEGIYNDMGGALEGNSPFQTVWLPDRVRESWLGRVREVADRRPQPYPGPIVFEGNVPADVRENAVLQSLLRAEAIRPTPAARLWLGAPVSIKDPTEAMFQRLSGNNLLMVGQREENMLAILAIGLVALAAQYPRGSIRFVLCDGTAPGSPQREFIDRIGQAVPHEVTRPKTTDLDALMEDLAKELEQRGNAEHTGHEPPVFLFLHQLQNYKRLRREDEFSFSVEAEPGPNPAARLNDLICDGPSHGFHVIATCDTFNNVNRFLSRKALSEFEMRVLFQMSANDSASLCDSPKASLLGLHRALFYNQQEGYLELFRPYALPGGDWIASAAQNLDRLLGRAASPTSLPGA